MLSGLAASFQLIGSVGVFFDSSHAAMEMVVVAVAVTMTRRHWSFTLAKIEAL
jgi:hypothetical protein